MTKSVTITIGRNLGDRSSTPGDPLSPHAWNQFVWRVILAFDEATTERWTQAAYRGSWDGRREDSFIFHGRLRDEESAVKQLGVALLNLADYYGQDSIGLSIGEATLIEPPGDSVPGVDAEEATEWPGL